MTRRRQHPMPAGEVEPRKSGRRQCRDIRQGRERLARADADGAQLPRLDIGLSAGEEGHVDLPRHQVERHRLLAAVRHVYDVDAGGRRQEHGCVMRAAADRAVGEVELARFLFRQRDQVADGLHRQARPDHQEERDDARARDRREIRDGVEG